MQTEAIDFASNAQAMSFLTESWLLTTKAAWRYAPLCRTQFERAPLDYVLLRHGRSKVSSFIVVDRSGREHSLDGDTDRTMMEAIRDGGLDELLALCGGCLSCATCHVHVDPEFMTLLPPMSDDENDLLDSSDHRNAHSRLACQIPLSSELSGLRVTIAPED